MKFKECNSCENARWYGGFACVDCDCEPDARPTQFKPSDEAILASVRKVLCAMLQATSVPPLCSTREFTPEKVEYYRDWHWRACLERAMTGDPDPMREKETPWTPERSKNAALGFAIGLTAMNIAKEAKP